MFNFERLYTLSHLGSYVCEELVKAGCEVTVIDNLSSGKAEWLPDDVTFINLDLVTDSPQFLLGHIDDCSPDVIINLAAKVTGITYNEKHHYNMAQANTMLATIPLAAALECRVPRYVYTSSACVYPPDAMIPTPEFQGWLGDPEPTNQGYGEAKRHGEKLCMMAADEHDWF